MVMLYFSPYAPVPRSGGFPRIYTECTQNPFDCIGAIAKGAKKKGYSWVLNSVCVCIRKHGGGGGNIIRGESNV